MKFYERIKKRRKDLGMSQEELAKKLGYKSRSSINKIELGYNDIPQSKLEAFAAALSVSPEYLLGWVDDTFTTSLNNILNSDGLNIGSKIKRRREELGLSVDELAEKLGKNRATIYRYESKSIENMPITILLPLVKVLNVSIEYLLGYVDSGLTSNPNIIPCSENDTEGDCLNDKEKDLINLYRKFNDEGQSKLHEYLFDLITIEKYKKNNCLSGDITTETKFA